MDEKVTVYGNGVITVIFIILTVILAVSKIISLCVLSALVAITQLILFFTSPRCYVFSDEKVVIKYYFGLEENILWHDLKDIYYTQEYVSRLYCCVKQYQLIYYTEEKHKSFMQGKINKNRKTGQLIEKYCPLKID